MRTYQVICGNVMCYIDVKALSGLGSERYFTAIPYMVEAGEWIPFAGTSESPAELEGDSEAQALEQACEFLEHRLGGRQRSPLAIAVPDGERKIGTAREVPILEVQPVAAYQEARTFERA